MTKATIIKQEPIITVVIPFYNVEKYIEKCLYSVINQTFTAFECILVDDESPDNSYEVALNIIQNDPRFRIIRQQNKGLGGARNTGIEAAKGEYICFLDSDDWWEPNFLEVMYQSAVENQADMVCCQHKCIDENMNIFQPVYKIKPGEYIKPNLFLFLMEYHIAWDKFYKRKIFNKIEFPEKIYYEDFATVYKTAFCIDKLIVVNDILCNYFRRKSSITTVNLTEKHIKDKVFIVGDIFSFLENVNIEKNIKKQLLKYALFVFKDLIFYCVKSKDEIILNILRRELIKYNFFLNDIFRNRIFSKISILLILFKYRLINKLLIFLYGMFKNK